uniref:SH2 domain-containing protein n=1 Tax=Schistosoma mansoni TaxID=6183 RepID=A0A5K4FCJ2_SCHMA
MYWLFTSKFLLFFLNKRNNRTRRIHMSHVSSGEGQREPPETVTQQPHSFDGPVSRYRDECLSTTSYSQRSIQKPFRSLNISTDSSQIKPPSITRDSIDGYIPYYYESVFEKHPEIMNNNINKTDEKLNFSSSDHNKSYHRNSINPKSAQKSSFTQHRNFTTINTNSSSNSNQTTNDFIDHTLPLITNNDPLLINHTSRERINSPKESDRIQEEYLNQCNQSDIYNNKPIVYNTNNVNDNILSYYHVNVTSRNTERVSNTINPNQRHSFSEKVKLSRLPNVTSLPEKYRLTHTLSDENRNKMMSATMSTTNTSQSLRKLVNFKKSPQTSIDYTGQHVNYELYRRESKYSHILDPSLSMDCSVVSHQPHQSMYGERRYSRHLKPLDAWQSRQSHSMEIVYSTPNNQRSLSSPQKRSPLSKQAAIRKLPAIYSRSLQHSTCSFPIQWGGFLSGPTLSLTSAFDSSSLTPDSLNHRQFFRSSLDSHEPTQLISGIQHQQYHRTHNLYKDKFFIPQDHTYSATESPKNLNPLEETIHKSRNIKSLQQSRINLSPWPYNAHSVTRKVHSFELNPNIHCQQSIPDFIRNTTVLLNVKDNLPLTYSDSSSRRGSANSNNSVFIMKELKSKLNNDLLPTNDLMSTNDTNYNDNSIINPSSLHNCKTKPLEKLIPPDLIFSPASRRASMMDEDISSIQTSILNVTNNLQEFYIDHTRNNDNNNNIPMRSSSNDSNNNTTNNSNISNTNNSNQLNQLMPTNLLSYQNLNLKYNRHKSADIYISPNKLNNLQNFYSHRNSTNIQYNNDKKFLSQTYFQSSGQQNLTPSHSPLLLINNNNTNTNNSNSNNEYYYNEDNYIHCPYQSNLHVTCCSQIDMRTIQNGWDSSIHQSIIGNNNHNHNPKHRIQQSLNTNKLINKSSLDIYNSDYNLIKHYKESLSLDERNDYEDLHCINNNNKQTKSISDEEYTDNKLLSRSSKMKTLKGKDYLFKSTRGSDTNIIDPQLLKPSLGPVIDSSDENTSDLCDDDDVDNNYDEGVQRSQSMSIPSSITTPLQSKIYDRDKKSNKIKDIDPKVDSHAARRKSFLENYWQQTIQQDDEQSNEDTNESNDEFNTTNNKSNRYESTSGLNNYRMKYYAEDNNDNVNQRDSTLLQINRSINTRCKSSDSGLNYFNNFISSNNDNKKLSNTRELPSIHQQQQHHHHQDYHSIRRKSRRKSKYHL